MIILSHHCIVWKILLYVYYFNKKILHASFIFNWLMQILNSICLEIFQLFQLCFAQKQRHNLKAPSKPLKRNAPKQRKKQGPNMSLHVVVCCALRKKERQIWVCTWAEKRQKKDEKIKGLSDSPYKCTWAKERKRNRLLL